MVQANTKQVDKWKKIHWDDHHTRSRLGLRTEYRACGRTLLNLKNCSLSLWLLVQALTKKQEDRIQCRSRRCWNNPRQKRAQYIWERREISKAAAWGWALCGQKWGWSGSEDLNILVADKLRQGIWILFKGYYKATMISLSTREIQFYTVAATWSWRKMAERRSRELV